MIYVEDDAHMMLLKGLGIGKKSLWKAGDKFRVCKKLEKGALHCIGIIDSDDGQSDPALLLKMNLVDEKHLIRLYEDSGKKIKIIVLCPLHLEDWVLKICKQVGIDAKKDFNLENSHKELHKVINNRQQKFHDLIKFLLDQKNPAILHLKSLIE